MITAKILLFGEYSSASYAVFLLLKKNRIIALSMSEGEVRGFAQNSGSLNDISGNTIIPHYSDYN